MVFSDNDNQLPVQIDECLPVPLPDLGPVQKVSASSFPDWENWAHQCYVRDIAQCRQKGDLWLATGGGILRWYPEFKQFSRYTSENGLPGNSISSIIIDKKGNIYCAPTNGGLYTFVDGKWSPIHESLPIRCMAITTEGYLIAGAPDGIYQLNETTHTIEQIHNFPSLEAPRSITVTDKGHIWVCNSLGLFLFDGTTIKQAGKQPTLLKLACHDSILWVGKMNGLVAIDLKTNKPKQESQWPVGTISALLPDSEGVFLVCDRIFGRVSGSRWQPLLENIEGYCSKLIADSKEGLWLSTHCGLQHWSNGKTRQIGTQKAPDLICGPDVMKNDIHFGNIFQCLTIENVFDEAILWAATQDGLFKYTSDKYTLTDYEYVHLDGINRIQSLTTGINPGDIWFSSCTGGIFNLQMNKISDISALILSFSKGFDAVCWAVGTDALYQHTDDRWKSLLHSTQLNPGLTLWTVAQTKKHYLWMGTSSGLIGYNFESGAIECPKKNPFTKKILSLAYDKRNEILWAGTEFGLFGLKAAEDGWSIVDQFCFTVMNSGLADNQILSLALDDATPNHPNLWIGTACGLCKYQYQQ
jgi:ligand-binding sensor domain-containing protein